MSIAPEIGVPIAEKLSYVTDDHLCNLYVKLLSTASNADTLSNAHPSFVNIINNMSPDEAILLEGFISVNAIPFVQARAVKPITGEYINISDTIVLEEALSGLVFPKNIDAYLSNLSSLGLLAVNNTQWLADESNYTSLIKRNTQEFLDIISTNPNLAERTLDFTKGFVRLTSFGSKFIEACHAK